MQHDDSIETLLAKSVAQLAEVGNTSAQLDAAVLLCHVLDKPRSYLLTWPEKSITHDELKRFQALLHRRISGEPIAYIVGSREFWSLPLEVSTSTLIPRPDTERLVELAIEKVAQQDGPILDLGTGTGAIALAIASEFRDRVVFGVDLQDDAVALAKRNSEQLSIHNCHFQQSSWFDSIEVGTEFAVIVSNPPYIDELDPHLEQGDVRFEPKTALVAAENGLADIRHIAAKSVEFLKKNGWLLFEHGYEQGLAVRNILLEHDFVCVETHTDYAGLDRVTLGKFKGK